MTTGLASPPSRESTRDLGSGDESELEGASLLDLYYREIRQVPLLTRDGEQALGRQMEERRYLLRIESELAPGPQSASAVTRRLLQRLMAQLPLLDQLTHCADSRRLDAGLGLGTAGRALGLPEVAAAVAALRATDKIDGVLAPDLVQRLTLTVALSEDEVSAGLIELSILTRILGPEWLEELAGGPLNLLPAATTLKDLGVPPALGDRLESHYADLKRGGWQAERTLVASNLRLVVSIAKRFQRPGVSLPDLIQEGNLGLFLTAAKFDHRRGTKFSTYATWWIRMMVNRAVFKQSVAVKVPTYVQEQLHHLDRLERRLTQQKFREPTPEELASVWAEESGQGKAPWTAEQIREFRVVLGPTTSLEGSVGDPDRDAVLADLIVDPATTDLDDFVVGTLAEDAAATTLRGVLATSLSDRERHVLELRFGLLDGRERTLPAVGAEFGVSGERARQIQKKALSRLRESKRLARVAGRRLTSGNPS